jgi:hypothetical protein
MKTNPAKTRADFVCALLNSGEIETAHELQREFDRLSAKVMAVYPAGLRLAVDLARDAYEDAPADENWIALKTALIEQSLALPLYGARRFAKEVLGKFVNDRVKPFAAAIVERCLAPASDQRDQVRADLQKECDRIGIELTESKALAAAEKPVRALERLAAKIESLSSAADQGAIAGFSPNYILKLLGHEAQCEPTPIVPTSRRTLKHNIGVSLYDLSDDELRKEARRRSVENVDNPHMTRERLIAEIQQKTLQERIREIQEVNYPTSAPVVVATV